jgi:hypothetical protein
MFRAGATRAVVLFGPWAFKLARGKRGVQCNRHEADLFLRNKAKAHRRSMLCCVLWCSWPAVVLIMRRAATPITGAQLQALKAAAWSKWDYLGPGDDECPFEWKLDDWGTLNGRLIAVDYAATARDQFPRLRE